MVLWLCAGILRRPWPRHGVVVVRLGATTRKYTPFTAKCNPRGQHLREPRRRAATSARAAELGRHLEPQRLVCPHENGVGPGEPGFPPRVGVRSDAQMGAPRLDRDRLPPRTTARGAVVARVRRSFDHDVSATSADGAAIVKPLLEHALAHTAHRAPRLAGTGRPRGEKAQRVGIGRQLVHVLQPEELLSERVANSPNGEGHYPVESNLTIGIRLE